MEPPRIVRVPEIPGFTDLVVYRRGGFGTVYSAVQQLVDRTVAIKVLDRAEVTPRNLELFARECAAIGRLDRHPNVVKVYAAGQTADGLPYIAMEMLSRGSVGDIIDRDGPLPFLAVVRIGAEVAGALSAAHGSGVLHRDLKPGNVLLDDDGRAVLCDFGIARFIDSTLTTASTTVGTLAYMSPELFRGDRASTASDIYALGLTLRVMLTVRHPFLTGEEETPYAIINRILGEPLPLLAAGGASGSVAAARFGALIDACCAKEPSQRPGTADAVRGELDAIADAAVVAANRPPTPSPPSRPETAPLPTPPPTSPPEEGGSSRTQRSTWLWLALAAAVLAVALVGGAVLAEVSRGGEDPPGDDQVDDTRAESTESSTPPAATPPDTITEGTLTACVFTTIPPFISDGDRAGAVQGLDVDILEEIAGEAELTVTYTVPDGDVLTGPAARECDVAAGGITITDEREESVDFTDPYLDAPLSLLVRQGSEVGSVADLDEATIGVVGAETVGAAYVTDVLGRDDAVSYGTPTELAEAVEAGEVVAGIQDLPLNQYATTLLPGVVVVETIDTGDQLGFGVAPGNDSVLALLNDGLGRLEADGTLVEMTARWLG